MSVLILFIMFPYFFDKKYAVSNFFLEGLKVTKIFSRIYIHGICQIRGLESTYFPLISMESLV